MTTFHFAHHLNKLHDGRAADCPECAASTETNHGARIPLPDEQHFTGLRVSVEGSSLPPDNPPRDVDDETERDIIRFREAVRNEVDVPALPAETYAVRKLEANHEIRDAGNALRARIAEIQTDYAEACEAIRILEENVREARECADRLREISITPEEAEHIQLGRYNVATAFFGTFNHPLDLSIFAKCARAHQGAEEAP